VSDGEANPSGFAPQHAPRPLPLFLDLLRSETAASPERRAAALAGLAAYQQARRPPPPPPAPAVASQGRARLLSHGGEGPPLVFVPSLINPPSVLDLDAERSLTRWAAARGWHSLLVDWGEPAPADRGQDVDAHVTGLLLPLLAALPEPPVLVGYCLGGTIALAAAALAPVRAVATIAAPWRFAGYGEEARARMAALWSAARPGCEALGLVPMEVLQAGFWRLDPARTVAKFEAFGRMEPGSRAADAFVRLEDWANTGAPLTYAAGRQLFEAFVADDLPGTGRWLADPARLPCPAAEFVSLTDRITPAATAAGLPTRVELALGHVGMVVGARAPAMLWEPLLDWIAAATGRI
jgi:polyhydroxyalkanoate synthase subunit PhaC